MTELKKLNPIPLKIKSKEFVIYIRENTKQKTPIKASNVYVPPGPNLVSAQVIWPIKRLTPKRYMINKMLSTQPIRPKTILIILFFIKLFLF